VRKSEFANAIQLSLACGAAGRDGRHPARASGGDGAAASPSGVGDRLGCGTALAGVAAADGSIGRGPAQPLIDRFTWRHKRLAKSAAELENHPRDQGLAERAAGRRLRCRARPARGGAVGGGGRLAGCRRLIGEAEPRERIARLLFTERVPTLGAHVIEQDVELASAVVGDALAPAAPGFRWMLPPRPGPTSFFHFRRTNCRAHHPGAGWGAKRWPAERYAEVVRVLVGRGLRVLINSVLARRRLPTPSSRAPTARPSRSPVRWRN